VPVYLPPDLTAHDLIVDAMAEIGALAAGEEPAAEDAALGLRRLNGMLDGWTIERYTIGAAQQYVFPLTAGQQTYTLGPGGDFDAPWPAWLEAASVRYPSGGAPPTVDQPLDLWTDQRWQQTALPANVTGIPTALYSDRAFPLTTLTFYGVPTGAGLEAVLWFPVATLRFVDLATVYRVEPGVSEALLYNVAARLCEPFTRPLTPHVAAMAATTLARVKRLHAPRLELAVDPALRGRAAGGPRDIRTDT
jgi:hypothetical protein